MSSAWEELITVLSNVETPETLQAFLEEILTTREISVLSLRWQLLKELYAGETQRKIAERHGISLCKITRGSKILKKKGSTTRSLLEQMVPPER
ncbi:MAG: transcriptional regulator [Deltaproteobacteria bacterium]|nr:MAG: transcriptional regulator [Deltaproteobacteria bacterium]